MLIVIVLMIRKPAPVAAEQAPAAVATNSKAFQQKLNDLAQPTSTESPSDAPTQVSFTSEEVQAALQSAAAPAQGTAASSPSSKSLDDARIPANAPPPSVVFENDVVRGQFQAEVAGKTVYVTVAGHLGAKDGYATFDPTEFKIGDLTVPVSMVNDQLQKKMADQRDQLKLPDFIADISVQNGQLVIKRK
jgi:hypothetical protein